MITQSLTKKLLIMKKFIVLISMLILLTISMSACGHVVTVITLKDYFIMFIITIVILVILFFVIRYYILKLINKIKSYFNKK
jgi:hypothetical protein